MGHSFFINKVKLKSVFILSLLITQIMAFSTLSSGCSLQKNIPFAGTGMYFDTVITITLYPPSSQKLIKECMELAGYYENLFSTTVEGSDIWKINHSDGNPVTVQDETLELLQTALSYARHSDGAVDPSIGTLSALWNFGSASQELIPSDSEIIEALSHVNYKKINIHENQVTLSDSDARLDLGFIAKGFIADKMKAYLKNKGVSSGIINLGGNIITIGNKPDGSPFKIGIQKPFASTGTSALTLDLSDSSTVSSGNYERYFIKNNILYHHILSTETGYPVNNDLSGVTIISKNSVDGDALSTLCFIYGYEKAASLLKNYPDIKAVFIMADGQIHYTNFG